VRNLLATLLCSQGTPMLLAGDEFGRTQQGNNNAYCQDSTISWVDWSLQNHHHALVDFVQHVVALRRATPQLRQTRFLHGAALAPSTMKDVTWVTPGGGEITDAQWSDGSLRTFGMLLGGDDACLLILNPAEDEIEWALPESFRSMNWTKALDTRVATGQPDDTAVDGGRLTVSPRTVVLLKAQKPGTAN
jgi:glycogen operon protein